MACRLGYYRYCSIDPYSSASNLEESTLSFSGANHTIYRFSEMYTNRALGWEKSYNTNIGLMLPS